MQKRREAGSHSPKGQLENYAQLAASSSGVRFWLPFAALLLGSVILIPVIWVGLAHWAGISLNAASGVGDLLATIGGVMGAVFTVGGLVIALVSVYTQLSLENRIRQTFEEQLPKFDERAYTQISAYFAFTRATEVGDWRSAQELARDALAKWPTLHGVRSRMGERLSSTVMDWFTLREIEGAHPAAASWGYSTEGAPGIGVTSIYGLQQVYAPPPALYDSRDNLPWLEAIRWLDDAILHDEDADGALRARLALMYGTLGRFQEMQLAVSETLKINAGQRAYLLQPPNTAMLAYSCKNASSLEIGLRELGEQLGISLPATPLAVMRSLQAVDMSQGTYNWNVYWVVFEKPAPLGSNRPVNMASLHILLGGSAEDRTGVARQMSPGQGPDTVIPAAGVKASMKELIDQLSDKYVFVCEYDVRTMHL